MDSRRVSSSETKLFGLRMTNFFSWHYFKRLMDRIKLRRGILFSEFLLGLFTTILLGIMIGEQTSGMQRVAFLCGLVIPAVLAQIWSLLFFIGIIHQVFKFGIQVFKFGIFKFGNLSDAKRRYGKGDFEDYVADYLFVNCWRWALIAFLSPYIRTFTPLQLGVFITLCLFMVCFFFSAWFRYGTRKQVTDSKKILAAPE